MPYYPPQPDHKPADHPPHKRIILRRMILCFFVLLTAYGVMCFIGYGADLISLRQTTQELREIASESSAFETEPITAPPSTEKPSTPSPPVSQPEETSALPDTLPEIEYPNGYNLVPRIRKLRKKSEYIIGWITMDDLDEPVALKDNVFFSEP